MFFQFETLFPQVRVYFRLEGLHVEIFSARDVIPLDPNGDCQVSSPYLIFVFFYTTAIWDQEILYLKVHKFATKVSSQKTVRLCVKQFFCVRVGKFYNQLNFLRNQQLWWLWQTWGVVITRYPWTLKNIAKIANVNEKWQEWVILSLFELSNFSEESKAKACSSSWGQRVSSLDTSSLTHPPH